MLKFDLDKAAEPEIKFPTSVGSQRKQAENFCFIDYVKIFEFVGHNKLWIILRWEYQTNLPVSW